MREMVFDDCHKEWVHKGDFKHIHDKGNYKKYQIQK